VAGQDKVDDAAAQPDEDGPIAGGAPNFARSVAGLELDAASAEVPDSFGPNARPEVVKLLRRALRSSVHDSMNRHYQPRWGAGADSGGRCCPDEIPPRHSLSRAP